ncbi:MAG: FMN-binding domain-containing protein [Spirochaetae bacterium HGW-Spirochaetae-3]|jgi:uncharacterized protein with FMN-binding domain|nr:MAG: FMN-binding domain-containing protein [Spirochaetae bacterium HGW-Spirochaetae-3]
MGFKINEAMEGKGVRMAALVLLILSVTIVASCKMPFIEIGNPDLSLVLDGTWVGYYDAELVKAKVAVVVADHYIESVTILEHDCSSIGEKAESIVNDIVARQSLEVDAVSGATGSSRCILKATEIALYAGME